MQFEKKSITKRFFISLDEKINQEIKIYNNFIYKN